MEELRNNRNVIIGIVLSLLVIFYLLYNYKDSTKSNPSTTSDKIGYLYIQQAREHLRAQQPEAAMVSIRTACENGYQDVMALMQRPAFYTLIEDSSTRPVIKEILEKYATSSIASTYINGEPGDRIIVHGIVRNRQDDSPVSDATITLVHTDYQGKYFTEQTQWNPRLFAVVRSDSTGRFTINALAPGRYKDEEGQWVASHVHYNITAPKFTPMGSEFTFDNDSVFMANGNVDQVAVAHLRKDEVNISYDVSLYVDRR